LDAGLGNPRTSTVRGEKEEEEDVYEDYCGSKYIVVFTIPRSKGM